MSSIKAYFRRVPGWLIWLILIGALYSSGWHTEVIGQMQRLILVTGIFKPKVEQVNQTTLAEKTNANNTSAAPKKTASYDFVLQSLDGKIIPMDTFKGKVVFMNFWATWCPPCIAEMPNIQSLYSQVKSNKIAFVMISLDQDAAKARQFIQRKKFTFPVYFLHSTLPATYAERVIPTTYVLSPEGTIVSRQEGMADYDNPEFRNSLQNLIK